jgi:hypothetical protein
MTIGNTRPGCRPAQALQHGLQGSSRPAGTPPAALDDRIRSGAAMSAPTVDRRRWFALAVLWLVACDRPAGLPPAPAPGPENRPQGLRPPALPGSAPSRPVG